MKICVATVCNDPYIDGLLAMVQSLQEHCSFDFDLKVIHSDRIAFLSEKNQERVKRTHPDTFFHNIGKELEDTYLDLIAQNKFTQSNPRWKRVIPAYLLLETVNTPDYDWVISMGTDMIAVDDLKPLLATDEAITVTYMGRSMYKDARRWYGRNMKGSYLQETLNTPHNKEIYPRGETKPWVCSAPIVLNMKKLDWKSSMLANYLRNGIAKEENFCYPGGDEPIINNWLKDERVRVIPGVRFNVIQTLLLKRDKFKTGKNEEERWTHYNPAIIHFGGAMKPWDSKGMKHPDKVYETWRYYHKLATRPFTAHETARFDDQNPDIGRGTKIWANVHVCKGAKIGKNCVIGENVYIGPGVVIGNNCKIQNNSLIYEGLFIGNNVFLGPNTVTTNDIFPKAQGDWKHRFRETVIEDNVAVGAGCVIVCGITLERGCMVGAGSVVTKNVKEKNVVYGNPARRHGFVDDKKYENLS